MVERENARYVSLNVAIMRSSELQDAVLREDEGNMREKEREERRKILMVAKYLDRRPVFRVSLFKRQGTRAECAPGRAEP